MGKTVKSVKSRILLGALVAASMTLPIMAQPPASVVMRSGERRPALNLGLFDGATLIVRTSFEEEPRIPISQVAYIDFGNSADAPVRFLRGAQQHALAMRDGRVMNGVVTRIAHENQDDQKSPYVVTMRMPNGQEQQMRGADIARVYFGESSGGATGTAVMQQGRNRQDAAPPPQTQQQGFEDARTISVSARQQWTTTGMRVRKGDRIGLRSSGQIRLTTQGMTASPDGSGQYDPRAPLPQVFSGALIGRIGDGRPFAIGGQGQIEAPDTGVFQLGVNDSMLNDNDGAFRVEVRRIQ